MEQTTSALDASVAGPPELHPARWRVLAVGVAAQAMVLFDLGIVNVILPSIGADLHGNASQLVWVVAGYAIAIGVVPIIGGRLGDDRGRRRMLQLGTGGFVATSALVGLAPTMAVVLVGRVLQGLSGGLINPQVSGIVQQVFPPPERGRAFGLIGATVGVCTAVGPALGGALVALGGADVGWRLCFLVNVPSGLVVLILAQRWWPPAHAQQHRRLDLSGAALLTAALLGALHPAVQFTTSRSVWLLAVLAAGVAFAALFVYWEYGPARRRGYALIDVTLLRVRSFARGLGVALCYFSAFNGLTLVLALYLQDGLQLHPGAAGCVVAMFALGTSGGALLGGRLVRRHGAEVLPLALGCFGLGVVATGLVAGLLSGTLATGWVVAALAVPLLVSGFGGGGVVSPNQVLALGDLGPRGGSTAGAMVQTAQRLGNAGGAAVLSSLYFYVARRGGSAGATARSGHAYAAALAVCLLFVALALVLALRDVRHLRRTHPLATAAALAPARSAT